MEGVEQLRQALEAQGYGERLLVEEPLAQHTTFAIGGPADLLVTVRTLAELRACLQLAWDARVPTLLIGGGSNILVADAGVRGLVIVNACEAFHLQPDGLLVAESGVPLRTVARWAVGHGWAGLEWAAGVPGTLGGAVVGNAGAYGGCMADAVRHVTYSLPRGAPLPAWLATQRADEADGCYRLDVGTLAYGYRTSILKTGSGTKGAVLEVALQLTPGDRDALQAIAARNMAERQARTPEGCCAGSIFKRTLQYPAGFLIERAGLKGRRVGGAEVSPQHANFLMNIGGATAADVRALIALVQKEVWAVSGQRLEPEIEFVGEWS